MKKLGIGILLCSLLLTACSTPAKQTETSKENTSTSSTNTSDASTSVANTGDKKKVGILQYVTHDALDNARLGFIEGLAANGFKDGENITIDTQNANADQSNLKTISQKFANDKLDLALAIATPAVQSLYAETKELPIVLAAVTDPKTAGVVESNEKPNTNVTGVSDLSPVKEHITFIKKINPKAKNIGIIYTASEANSLLQVDLAKEQAAIEGLTVIEKTITTSNDIAQVAESLVGKVDFIYAPTDNTLFSGINSLLSVTQPNKIPVVVADISVIKTSSGALISKGADFKEMGLKAGEMAAKILKGDSSPKDMPIEYGPNPKVYIDMKAAAELGITIPDELQKDAVLIK